MSFAFIVLSRKPCPQHPQITWQGGNPDTFFFGETSRQRKDVEVIIQRPTARRRATGRRLGIRVVEAAGLGVAGDGDPREEVDGAGIGGQEPQLGVVGQVRQQTTGPPLMG